MVRRRSAESLRIAAAGFLFTLGCAQVLADTPDASTAASTAGSPDASNPAQAFTRMFGGSAAADAGNAPAAPKRHRRSHRSTPAEDASASSAPASWLPKSTQAVTASASAAEAGHDGSEAPIVSTFSKAPAESRVSDWLPSSDNATASQESLSTSARIDLIAEKVGKQTTVDFNSRIQEPNGVIAFRAIDNQTGERQTIRIDRSGDIKLKSGWPN